jgi:hypothetical protein
MTGKMNWNRARLRGRPTTDYRFEQEQEDVASATFKPVTEQGIDPRAEFRPTPKPVIDPVLIKRLERTPNPWASLGWVIALAFGIPLAVLALGSSLVWALSGFAATRQP